MKKLKVLSILFFIVNFSFAQYNETFEKAQQESKEFIVVGKSYKIKKSDGVEVIGKVLKADDSELVIVTKGLGEIHLPRGTILKATYIDKSKGFGEDGKLIDGDEFPTRYFFSTNALSLKKGEYYRHMALFGPDVQFGLKGNMSAGAMTTWFANPFILSFKKSFELDKDIHLSVGAIGGITFYPQLGRDYGILPFATFSLGDRRRNISFSAGYGNFGGAVNAQFFNTNKIFASIGGMIKVVPKVTLVFDSFFLIPSTPGDFSLSALIPGIRFHQAKGKAFQVGIVGLSYYGLPTSNNSNRGLFSPNFSLPIPMISWFRSF